jgi:glycine cleavage system H protein
MDGFSYTNIFETKGIEYLIIIAFLIIIIPFWIIINRKSGIKRQIKYAIDGLSASVLRIPQGLFYSKNHTWTHLEKSGIARVGLDDFLMHITGEVKFSYLINPDSYIKKGDLLADIDQNGKHLRIYSPISGRIMHTNEILYDNPGILNDDPYGKGWIYRIKPTEWIAETEAYFLADKATTWSINEFNRFLDFLSGSINIHTPEGSLLIMQDGGELRDQPLRELPDEVWQDFQKSFLNQT